MELKQYITFAWRWIWLIALCAAIGGGFGFYTANKKPKLYAATAILLVNQEQGAYASPSPSLEDLRARERFALTVMEVMRTRPVVSEALLNLGLNETVSVGLVQARVSLSQLGETELVTLEVRDEKKARAVDISNELIEVFQVRERELLANPFAQGSSVKVIEAPRALTNPVEPTPTADMSLFAAVGALLAIVIGILRDYYNDTMRGGNDMERLTGFTPVATIGQLKGTSAAARLVTIRDPYSANAETYRMFRTYLDTFPLDRPVQTIVVTSPNPLAGKSTTAANLAVALAQTGRQIILVDADMRQPAIHEFFGISNDEGLASLVNHNLDRLSSYLRPSGVENLRLITGGPSPLHPAQLIGSAEFEQMVEQLRSEADIIIFDSTALLQVVDATLLMRCADVALIVARADSTRAENLTRTIDHLKQSGVNILGVLFNAAPFKRNRDLTYYDQIYRRYTSQKRPAGTPVESRLLPQTVKPGQAPKIGD